MRQRSEVSYLAALSLALSVIEASLPHALPFLRLGLANLSLLWALTRLCAKDYFILALIKWLLSSFIAGTLFSPYSLVSFAGNASSSIVMFILFRYCSRLFSLYAVSASGSVISAVFQLLSASLFLSSSVLSLIPVMMIFNLFTGLVLAFIAYHVMEAEPCLSSLLQHWFLFFSHTAYLYLHFSSSLRLVFVSSAEEEYVPSSTS